MPALSAAPGSAEERAAFADLQGRLPDLFRRVFSDPAAPRTVVIVPGLSMDPEVLARVVGGLHYEERQLAMLMLLRLPRLLLHLLVSSFPRSSLRLTSGSRRSWRRLRRTARTLRSSGTSRLPRCRPSPTGTSL